jgi:hypothetical protein
MAEIIPFDPAVWETDLDAMDREELIGYLESVWAQIDQLDAREPKNMLSQAHQRWGERREELEDLADDIRDVLDELWGPGG